MNYQKQHHTLIDPYYTDSIIKFLVSLSNPNAMAQEYEVDKKTYIMIVTTRRVQMGQEITISYGKSWQPYSVK